LLSNRSIDEAAKAIGIATNTLLKWMKDPDFDAAYREARRLAYGQSVSRLHQASGAAASTVMKLMVDGSVPASVRLRAADIILERTSKAIELEDIEARLADLERAADESKTGGKR